MKTALTTVIALSTLTGTATAAEFDGLSVSPLGQATVDTSTGELQVSNIGSSGQDGVRVQLPDMMDLKIAIPAPGNPAAGVDPVWTLKSTGTVDGDAGTDIAELQIIGTSSDYEFTLDTFLPDVIDHDIHVFDNGELVASFSAPVGMPVASADLPISWGTGPLMRQVDDPGPCVPPKQDLYYCIGPGGHPCGINWVYLSASLQTCCDNHPEGLGIVHSCAIPSWIHIDWGEPVEMFVGGGGGLPGGNVIGDSVVFVPAMDHNRIASLSSVELRASGVDQMAISGFSSDGEVEPQCPGDANGDGFVNFDDLNQVLGAWLTTGPQGDVNNSGFVDFDDLNLILSNWGTECFPG